MALGFRGVVTFLFPKINPSVPRIAYRGLRAKPQRSFTMPLMFAYGEWLYLGSGCPEGAKRTPFSVRERWPWELGGEVFASQGTELPGTPARPNT